MVLPPGRWTAEPDGDLVVFLIGARHAPVCRAWNRLGSDDRGAAGVWHETFKVNAGNDEAIDQNTPVRGLQNTPVDRSP